MPDRSTPTQNRPNQSRGGRLEATFLFALLAICAAVIAGISWAHPTKEAAVVGYSQSGSLGYSAPTSAGSVYGSQGLSTGGPVYGEYVSNLNVTYAYRLATAAPAALHGTEQLVAKISNGQGISQTVAIQAQPVAFSGSHFSTSGTLSLAALSNLAETFESAAGIQSGGGSYAVSILPSIKVHGELAGQALRTAFSPSAVFTYSSGNLIPGGTGGKPNFNPKSGGSVVQPDGRAETLAFGIPVADARVGTLGLVAAALLLLGIAGYPLLRQATSSDEWTRIGARYGALAVEAGAVDTKAGLVGVELDSFEGLVQVSRRLQCPILHWEDRGDVYAVVDSGTLYRYSIEATAEGAPAPKAWKPEPGALAPQRAPAAK
jgi:hypothetical protein